MSAMSDAQIIEALVAAKATHPDPNVCALAALKKERRPGVYGGALSQFAFSEIGVSVATAFGIMSGFDNDEELFVEHKRRCPESFARGVEIGRAVRAAVITNANS